MLSGRFWGLLVCLLLFYFCVAFGFYVLLLFGLRGFIGLVLVYLLLWCCWVIHDVSCRLGLGICFAALTVVCMYTDMGVCVGLLRLGLQDYLVLRFCFGLLPAWFVFVCDCCGWVWFCFTSGCDFRAPCYLDLCVRVFLCAFWFGFVGVATVWCFWGFCCALLLLVWCSLVGNLESCVC